MDALYTGKIITQLRKEKEMTQKEIAEALHVSISAVSKWERGLNFPDLSLMEPLAQLLDSSVSYLLGLENAKSDQIVKDLTEISIKELKNSQKEILYKQKITFFTILLFFALLWFLLTMEWYNGFIGMIFSLVGFSFYNIAALILGFTAWFLPIYAIFSKTNMDYKFFSIISLGLCCLALYLPVLILDYLTRIHQYATIEDIVWGYNYASVVLISGCFLFNYLSFYLHNKIRKASH